MKEQRSIEMDVYDEHTLVKSRVIIGSALEAY